MQHSKLSSFGNHTPLATAVHGLSPVPPTGRGTRRAGLYILPGFPLEEYALFASALEDARAAFGNSQLETIALSDKGGLVSGSSNGSVGTQQVAEETKKLDFLVIFAGHSANLERNHRLKARLQTLRRDGCQIAAVSGAALAMVRAGIFSGSACSVHWQNRELFTGWVSSVEAVDRVCVVEAGDWSSCGKTGALDLALHVVSVVYGARSATRLAQNFVHSRLCDAESTQNGEVMHAALSGSRLVNEAIALFQKNIETPLSMTEASRKLGSSPRRIERQFQRHCGTSPFKYYRRVRVDHARRLLLRTNFPVIEIALATGFSTNSSLAAAFQHAYGTTPTGLRNALSTAEAA